MNPLNDFIQPKPSDLSQKWGFPMDWGNNAVGDSTFLGIKTQKNPTDAWIYQEILWEKRPDVIIECGSANGGSALYLATILDAIGHGRIISIEIQPNLVEAKHPRITFITGDTGSPDVAAMVKGMIKGGESVMAISDSNHYEDTTLKELNAYGEMVTSGQYFIVEDTFWRPDENSARTALEVFLRKHPEFSEDRKRERFVMTYNLHGYLLKA